MGKINFLLVCILFYSCQNNKNKPTISELIDLQKWDAITIKVIKDKMQLDTLQYPMGIRLMIDDVFINNFDEHIGHILSFREKEISTLLEQQVLSNEKSIYIYERQGYACNEGFIKYFIVMLDKKGRGYCFTYKTDTDSFFIEKGIYSIDYYKQPVFYNGIEYDYLTGIEITTKITKNKKHQLSYEVIGIAVD